MSPPDAFTAFSRGDAVAAEQLRRAFVAIRDHSADPEVARCARQVLDGRRSVREVVEEPEFQRAMAGGITRFHEEWEQLDEDQRRALLERGQAERAETARWLGLAAPRTGHSLTADRDVEAFLARRVDPTSTADSADSDGSAAC